MHALTKRQQMVLEYISQSITDKGYPPTLREIGAHMDIRSTNGVNDHLRALERKGYLKHESMKSRALKPVWFDKKDHPELIDVPLVASNIEETIKLDSFLVGDHQELFAVKAPDNSMIEAGIREGDFVFAERKNTARADDIVVVAVTEGMFIRKYRTDDHNVTFVPANPEFDRLVIPQEEFSPSQLLGVVKGLYRCF
jgi:repressor LexA